MLNLATWIRDCDLAFFQGIFAPYPDVRLCDARTTTVHWPEISGLLLTGGSDISAAYLHQPVPDPALIQDADTVRDAWEFPALEEALRRRLPVLAICRGLQILNVALGGTLLLDIPGHDDHKMENLQPLRHAAICSHRFAHVNSSHHQAIDQLGSGLVVESWCATDDVIEQVRLEDYPYAFGVQYHPERSELYRRLFDDFVKHLQPVTV